MLQASKIQNPPARCKMSPIGDLTHITSSWGGTFETVEACGVISEFSSCEGFLATTAAAVLGSYHVRRQMPTLLAPFALLFSSLINGAFFILIRNDGAQGCLIPCSFIWLPYLAVAGRTETVYEMMNEIFLFDIE